MQAELCSIVQLTQVLLFCGQFPPDKEVGNDSVHYWVLYLLMVNNKYKYKWATMALKEMQDKLPTKVQDKYFFLNSGSHNDNARQMAVKRLRTK